MWVLTCFDELCHPCCRSLSSVPSGKTAGMRSSTALTAAAARASAQSVRRSGRDQQRAARRAARSSVASGTRLNLTFLSITSVYHLIYMFSNHCTCTPTAIQSACANVVALLHGPKFHDVHTCKQQQRRVVNGWYVEEANGVEVYWHASKYKETQAWRRCWQMLADASTTHLGLLCTDAPHGQVAKKSRTTAKVREWARWITPLGSNVMLSILSSRSGQMKGPTG